MPAKKNKPTPPTDDLGSSAQAAQETKQVIGGVTFDKDDSRITPVTFQDKKPVPESSKTAADFYKPSNRGGRGLSDEEIEKVLVEAGTEPAKAE